MKAGPRQPIRATRLGDGEPRRRLLIIAGVLIACCTTSNAQTFYKWTDEHGVVHLADAPPPNPRGVEERNLPPPPPAEPGSAAGDGREAKAASGDTSPADTSRKSPAQVIVVSHQVVRRGPSAAHVIGEVKNVGGENADAVEITLRTLDATQGTLCLNEQTTVNPSTLPPGEHGNFDADIDSPCLAGDTPVDVAPVWK